MIRKYLGHPACVILMLCSAVHSAVTFTGAPAMVKNGSQWQVSFAVSEFTDVEVSIVNVRDSGVVRHLAAGLLGSNPPAPLVSNSLSQTLSWDGKDDFGRSAAQPESLSVRVRAGMTPRLANLAAEELYLFGVAAWHASATNILLDDDGSVLIFGHTSTAHFLRKYDPSGNYLKTLFPPPANLPAESVTVFGINVVPGGGWAPKTSSSMNPAVTNSFLNNTNTRILPIGGPGELVLVNGTDMQTMRKSGAIASAATRKLLTGPADPVYPLRLCGPEYYTASHNPSYLYLSGRYFGTVDMGTWLIDADTSGFWGDGQVFKVDRATGIASPWLKLDSVPVNKAERAVRIGGGANAFSAIHGVSLDDSLHVFVCDRLHRRVSVYDTNAVLLGSVACPNADLVAVSGRTGNVYVLTRGADMRLIKFPPWRTPGTAVASVLLTTNIDTYTGTPALVISESGDATTIWVGYGFMGIRLYRDDGASFTLLRDFAEGARALCFDRVTVDRRTDKAYWSNSDNLLGVCNNVNYSIPDWSNPVAEVESTSAHAKLNIVDLTVAPNGLVYGYRTTYWGAPVERYTTDRLHAPVPYANTGTNVSTGLLGSETRRGMAVGWQGQIAVTAYGASYDGVGGHDDNSVVLFADTGCADTGDYGRAVVKRLGSKASGVKFDAAGNLYVGTGVRSPDWRLKPGFESDNFYLNYSGSIVKYAPGDTGTVSGNTAGGASKVYPQPFGLYSGSGTGGWCTCRSPRFDVDPYGRLYVPNGASCNVVVADNSGNTIADFGQYGNTDCRGGLTGPGQTLAEPAIPLAWPTAVAASEDYVYVSDIVNARIARVRMDYALDNIPGLTDRNSVAEKKDGWKNLAMVSSPNPFNPVSTVRVALPAAGNIHLSVYDMNGRLVRTIAKGWKTTGIHGFEWKANDQAGKSVAAGLYVYRLTAGNRTLTLKTILAK